MPFTNSPSITEFLRIPVKRVAAVTLLALACVTLRSQTADSRPQPRQTPKNSTYPIAVAKPTPSGGSSPPAGTNSTQTSTPAATRGSNKPPGNAGGDNGDLGRDFAIGGAIAAGLTIAMIIKAAENRSHDGPNIKSKLDMNDFTVEGLAGANWPVGFDFTAGSPGSLNIEITSHGGHATSMPMRVVPGRRDSLRFYLPPDFNAKVQNAKYHVVFTPDAGSISGLRAFGLGAGDCAVVMNSKGTASYPCPRLTSTRIPLNPWGAGRPSLVLASWINGQAKKGVPQYGSSIQLDQVRFGPGTIQPKLKQMANYGFHALHAFNDVRADFMLMSNPNGHILLRKDREDQPFPIGEGEMAQKTWDPAKSKAGDHMLQLKMWRGLEAGGDWAVVWSQDVVTIEK